MSPTNSGKLEPILQKLHSACKTSAENLRAASEQMENRGQKALFIRFAQQLRLYANHQAVLAEQLGFTLSTPSRSKNWFARGWMDIRVAMIVGRANRQSAAAKSSDSDEKQLLELYEQLLQEPLPAPLQAEFQRQQVGVRTIYQWLQRLAAQDQWVIRLYDNAAQANEAVGQLKAAGFPETQLTVTPFREITEDTEDTEERSRSAVDATLAGATIGAVVGLIFGVAVNYATQIWSPTGQSFSFILWGALLLSGALGILVGGGFGSFFGFLLARGLYEEDKTVADSIPDLNSVVVSAHTTESNYNTAAKILQMWHQREVENMSVASQQRREEEFHGTQ
ncbi:MAG: hypothetical protein U0175_34295 [Caldilineaceae bacterium]